MLTFPKTPEMVLDALKPVLLDAHLSDWVDLDVIQASYESVLKNLEKDTQILKSWLQESINPDQSISIATSEIEDAFFRLGHMQGPSITALVLLICDRMKLDISPVIYQSVLLAALLGDVKTPLAYHNNKHFFKVVVQSARLLLVHHDLFGDTQQALSNEQSALVMLAACVHDLGHDGAGNMVKAIFHPGRLERKSNRIMRGYMQALGLAEEHIKTVETMILTTEVTPLNDPTNPVRQMKAAYRYHYRGDRSKVNGLSLDDDLQALQNNRKLTLMCLLLHEADIATSAGISYSITQHETILYRKEACGDEGTPQHVVDFIETVCHQQFLSDSGQRLYGANLARIYAKAQDDAENGDLPFMPKVMTDGEIVAEGLESMQVKGNNTIN